MASHFLRPDAGRSALRVHLAYWWRHGRRARLHDPRLFTEWVQHRKLHDRDPRLPVLADKLRVKQWVAERLGPEWVTPTIWSGRRLPEAPAATIPHVVKARHGCNQVVMVRSRSDHERARLVADEWVAGHYGRWLDEWLYSRIPRGLIAEPFLGEGTRWPIDYKVFVFGGEARFVQVHLGRGGRHRWIVFDRDWRRLSPASDDPDPPRPASLTAMLEGAECLARDFCFVRVDFFEIRGRPRFGEMTFYPGSGLHRIVPIELDLLMGLLWKAATPRWSGASRGFA